MRTRFLPWLVLLSIALSPSAGPAQEPEPTDYEPLFVGYETEPSMDYGGRTVSSLQTAASRGLGKLFKADRRPALAPAWEFPLSAFFLLVQHEVDGHGGRAREFDLSPTYGLGFDFSAYTSIDRTPSTNEQNVLLAAGGTEADGVLAHRILLDSLRPEGTDGAKIPLLLMTKLDLTRYISGAPEPEPGDDFVEQFEEGNDIAIYLVSRQGQRVGADPAAVWGREYAVDFDDPLLQETWDDARVTAVWNLLDPAVVSAVVAYFRQHVLQGTPRVQTPALRIGEDLALTVGTRGALGPQEVSRFLDFHALTRRGVVTVYVRDLDSSVDRTYGFGAGIHGLRWGQVQLGLGADTWEEPEAEEGLYEGRGWNVNGEVEALLGSRWGVSAKLGAKSDGFFPGRPIDEGVYAGFGVLAVW